MRLKLLRKIWVKKLENKDGEMKSFEKLLGIWELFNHHSVVNREAAFKQEALKKGYSQKAIITFIIRFLRGFCYSITDEYNFRG